MLHLISSLYASIFKEVEFNVLIVGQEASGKSTLLEQVKFMYSPSNPPTTDAPAGTNKPSRSGLRTDHGLANLKDDLRRSAAGPNAPISQAPHTPRTDNIATRTPVENPRTSPTSMAPGPGSAVKRSRPPVVPGVSEAASVVSAPSEPVACTERPPLPPGTPVPASRAYLDKRHIRPTVGMNYAKLTHYFAPLAAVVETEPVVSPSEELPPARTVPSSAAALHAAPNSTRTQLTFWDLGGQPSLRPLWRSYFAQCHGIILVVDAAAQSSATRTTDQQILLSLLQDPLLNQVPILIFCNKCDERDHLSLSEMQDALDLVGIAVQSSFYSREAMLAGQTPRTPGTPGKSSSTTSSDGVAAAARHEARTDVATAFSGAGGFGSRLCRLAEGSAQTGHGVAAGLDWLVSQLLREARTLATEEHK